MTKRKALRTQRYQLLKVKTVYLSLGTLLLFMVSVPAKAQQCSDILKHGIFDISSTSKQEDVVNSYLSWLSNVQTSSYSVARDVSGKIGVVLPTEIPIPLEVGGSSGNSESTTWGQALASYLSTHSDERKKFSQNFFTANTTIVNAWRDCVLNKKGLICWAEQTKNPDEMMLRMEWRPTVIPTTGLTSLTIQKIESSLNAQPSSPVEGKTIAGGIVSILYRREGTNKRNAVNFIVTTSDPNYSCDMPVDALPDLPPPAGAKVTFLKPTQGLSASGKAVEAEFRIDLTEGRKVAAIGLSLVDTSNNTIIRSEQIIPVARNAHFQLHYMTDPNVEHGKSYPQSYYDKFKLEGIVFVPSAQFVITVTLDNGQSVTSRSSSFSIDRRQGHP